MAALSIRPSTDRASEVWARAAFLGWLPLALINAAFVPRVPTHLALGERVLHHLYDAGQIVGLAAAAWIVYGLLWRLRLAARLAIGSVLSFAAHYALLGADLVSFVARTPNSSAKVLFPAAMTAALLATTVVAWFCSRSLLRWVGVAMGLGLALVNQRVLRLDYRGLHFIVAWMSASLIGFSSLHWVASHRVPRGLRLGCIAAGSVSVLSFLIPAGPVVRTALLGSTGAVAAPFTARVWTLLHRDSVPLHTPDSPWFKPRRGLPPIPAEPLPGAPRAPVVILLTLDALRSDILDRPEHAKAVPNLLAMREVSLSFARATSPAASTGPSLRQLFLGTYYSQHARSGKAGPHLGKLLQDGGVYAVLLRTHRVLTAGKGITDGFSKDLDVGDVAPSEKIVAEVLAQLDAHPQGPLFIYSHVLDAHGPYDRGGTVGTPKQRYVAEVAVLDKSIGALRAELAKRNLTDTTYLIVAADHGEAFNEHGRGAHGWTMYEEMIRIPLMVEGPGIQPRRVERSASLMDLGPTVLSLFGLATPAHFMGQSLVPFMRGETPQFSRPLAFDGDNHKQGLIFDDHVKAIIDNNDGTEELYDLRTDPGEMHNLAERPDAQGYFDTVRAFFRGLEPPPLR